MGYELFTGYISKPLILKKPEPPKGLPTFPVCPPPAPPHPAIEEAVSPTREIKWFLWRQSSLVLTSCPLTLLISYSFILCLLHSQPPCSASDVQGAPISGLCTHYPRCCLCLWLPPPDDNCRLPSPSPPSDFCWLECHLLLEASSDHCIRNCSTCPIFYCPLVFYFSLLHLPHIYYIFCFFVCFVPRHGPQWTLPLGIHSLG